MKDSTIITNFQQIQNKLNKLAQMTQQNIQQLYMIQSAQSLTIEAIVNIFVEKGIMTQEDVRVAIQKIQDKKNEKMNNIRENEMINQPVFETKSEVPGPEGEE